MYGVCEHSYWKKLGLGVREREGKLNGREIPSSCMSRRGREVWRENGLGVDECLRREREGT